MWSTLEEAMKKFGPHREKLLATRFSLPWVPAMKDRAAKHLENIYLKGIRRVRFNTPSIGQYWPTHPTYTYENGRTVFLKIAPVEVILREYHYLTRLKRYGVSVPTPVGVYIVPDDIFEEDILMSPNLIRGAILVEEFLHSISFGHALVERRVPVTSAISMTANAINWMHRFGVHGDLKHQHLRICVPSKEAVRMIFRSPRDDIVIDISRVSIIDMEGFTEIPVGVDGPEKRRADVDYLKGSIEGYLRQLDNETPEKIRRLTLMSSEERWMRFRGVWERLEAAIYATKRMSKNIKKIDKQ